MDIEKFLVDYELRVIGDGVDMRLGAFLEHATHCAYYAGYCAAVDDKKQGRPRRPTAKTIQRRLENSPQSSVHIIVKRIAE